MIFLMNVEVERKEEEKKKKERKGDTKKNEMRYIIKWKNKGIEFKIDDGMMTTMMMIGKRNGGRGKMTKERERTKGVEGGKKRRKEGRRKRGTRGTKGQANG